MLANCYCQTLEHRVNTLVHKYKNSSVSWYISLYHSTATIGKLEEPSNDMRQTRPPHACFSIMHGADTAWLNDVRRTRVSLHKFNSFPC